MKHCEILVTTKTGQVNAGSVSLVKNGQILVGYRPGYEVMMKDFEEDAKAAANKEIWFDNLPVIYNGSYVRAKMIIEKAEDG